MLNLMHLDSYNTFYYSVCECAGNPFMVFNVLSLPLNDQEEQALCAHAFLGKSIFATTLKETILTLFHFLST